MTRYARDVYHLFVQVTEGLEQVGARSHDPLPLRDPRDLVASIAEQAATLRWSVLEPGCGQLTDERAVELMVYLAGFVLARARVRELDIIAGDEVLAYVAVDPEELRRNPPSDDDDRDGMVCT